MKEVAAACVAVLVLGGCARHQVAPVAKLEGNQICIIENPRVRADFVEAYRKALGNRGFQTSMVPSTSALNVCPVTSKYVAYWAWDIVLYMQSARLDVYRDGRPAGRAMYNARSSRLVNTEDKIQELVDQLFTM
jgi:hypothetical protein